jgi:hypothetical protein
MDRDKILTLVGVSVALVLVGSLIGKALFAWLDTYLFRRKDQRDPTLDELIDHEFTRLGGKPRATGAAFAPRIKRTEEKAAAIEAPHDPLEFEKKEMLQRIYGFDFKRLQGESDEAFYLRVLDMKVREKPEVLKRAYKLRSKELHPDRFKLDIFDAKTKKRLAARVHENYLLVQKAYEHFKKTAA